MSGGEWKPGDVAVLSSMDGVDYLALRTDSGRWAMAMADVYDGTRLADSARRVVVIDPEDREQVERLLEGYANWGPGELAEYPHYVDNMQAALREFANPTPPKPEEPTGRYAAVQTAEGLEYVRLGDGPRPWMHNGSPQNSDTYAWSDVPAVRVLSEGVTP